MMPFTSTTPVTWKIESQTPTVISVQTQDGKKYQIRTAILVHDVSQTDKTNPITGVPVFNLTHQVLLDAVPVEGEKL